MNLEFRALQCLKCWACEVPWALEVLKCQIGLISLKSMSKLRELVIFTTKPVKT